MIGLVLSGGKSSRMGMDKGLLQSNSMSWVAIAEKKLEWLGLETWISINHSQNSAYKKILPDNLFIFDNKSVKVKGPLLGILSAHIHFPDDDILVLACDLLQMNVALLKGLIEKRKADKTSQAVLYRFEGELQPLCAIYSPASLTKILSMANAGYLKNFSLKRALSIFDLAELKCVENGKTAFKNFNTLSELGNIPTKG